MVVIEIVSKKMIKPSSPTPDHLKNLQLSFLDQIAPPVYTPLIFFYHHHELNLDTKNHVEKSQVLKQSLSQILTIYYPLAGRVNQENPSVDCNDEGAEFIEARAHIPLDEVIKEPKMDELQGFLPLQPLSQSEKVILSVKISYFDCGGVAVGVCMSHTIGDGPSLTTFINAWAAICRGEGNKVSRPIFDLAVDFPPKDLFGSGISADEGIIKEKITTRRLVFDKDTVERFKRIAAFGEVKNPTRVEAVSAFIWGCFIEVAKAKTETKKKTLFAAVHSVNLRPRTNPPLSEHAFGNCWRPAMAFLPGSEESSDLAGKLRVAIKEIDHDYIERVKNEDYLDHLNRSLEIFKGDTESCFFSSWCRYPVYDVDFGWGKPDWVCTTTAPFKNLVILMSSARGDGIETWINMADDDFKIVEKNYKLLY